MVKWKSKAEMYQKRSTMLLQETQSMMHRYQSTLQETQRMDEEVRKLIEDRSRLEKEVDNYKKSRFIVLS